VDLRQTALPFLLFSMVFVAFIASVGILPDASCILIATRFFNLPCVLIVFALWGLTILAFIEFLNHNWRKFYIVSCMFFGIALVLSWSWVLWSRVIVMVSFLAAIFGIWDTHWRTKDKR